MKEQNPDRRANPTAREALETILTNNKYAESDIRKFMRNLKDIGYTPQRATGDSITGKFTAIRNIRFPGDAEASPIPVWMYGGENNYTVGAKVTGVNPNDALNPLELSVEMKVRLENVEVEGIGLKHQAPCGYLTIPKGRFISVNNGNLVDRAVHVFEIIQGELKISKIIKQYNPNGNS